MITHLFKKNKCLMNNYKKNQNKTFEQNTTEVNHFHLSRGF